jgi:hypothetical protein
MVGIDKSFYQLTTKSIRGIEDDLKENVHIGKNANNITPARAFRR